MKDDRTYIKIFHKMLDWGWYGDTNTFRVFMHILLRANYRESEYLGHKIGAGECVFGRKEWAKKLGLSEQQVRTAISHLQSTHEITTRATNRFTIITVVNWESWQIEEGKATKRATNKQPTSQPTSNQQATTSKDSKNTTTIPTIYDVREYAKANNLIIDPDYFFKYYETAGWVDNKGKPVKNWKLKALNWNRREEERKDDIRRDDSRANDSQRGGLSGSTGRSGASPKIVGATVPRMGVSFEEEE